MDWVEAFKQHLIEDGKAKATISSYIHDTTEFVNFLKGIDITFDGRMTRFQATSFRKHLVEAGFKPRTINKNVNSIRCFGQFLIKRREMVENVVEPKKDKVRIAEGSNKRVEVFSEKEIEQMLFFVNGSKDIGLRNKLIIYILIYTGVRVTELVDIKCKDVDLLTMQLRVMGKGMKERTIPLKPEVAEVLREYLNTKRKNCKFADSDYLLISQRTRHMHRDAINKMLKVMADKLNVNIFPHKFRHTFCSRLISLGVPISTVAKLAGHANIQTTAEFYTDTSQKDKENALGLL